MIEAVDPNFKFAEIGMVGSDPTITVDGTAGGTQPIGTTDIYAYVFKTDNGTFAVASHGVEDSTEVTDDLQWRAHGGITLDSNNCITALNEAGDAELEDDMVSVSGSGATAINGAMTLKISPTEDNKLCVSQVWDQK